MREAASSIDRTAMPVVVGPCCDTHNTSGADVRPTRCAEKASEGVTSEQACKGAGELQLVLRLTKQVFDLRNCKSGSEHSLLPPRCREGTLRLSLAPQDNVRCWS